MYVGLTNFYSGHINIFLYSSNPSVVSVLSESYPQN